MFSEAFSTAVSQDEELREEFAFWQNTVTGKYAALIYDEHRNI
jgi:hypothetical protein